MAFRPGVRRESRLRRHRRVSMPRGYATSIVHRADRRPGPTLREMTFLVGAKKGLCIYIYFLKLYRGVPARDSAPPLHVRVPPREFDGLPSAGAAPAL